jgi:hypothetical protein
MSFTNAATGTGLLTGRIISLVNVLDPQRQLQSPRGLCLAHSWATVGPAPETQAARAFAFQPSGRALTQLTGECRRRTHQSDALYSRARRANFQTVSQEQSYKVMIGLALRNRGALEIMKSDAMRAVVLPGWPNGEHHPMGPCYV